ncbi:MAG: transposase, partial [Firmicutes bacterium]|nr:transposase [Bacillota bacterium]
MILRQAFRYELAPTPRQATALARSAGTARFAYNWGLDICRALLGKHLPIPSAMELHRMWNAYKREHAPWAYEVSKCTGQEALRDVRAAFDHFFASRKGKQAGPKMGFPCYRKKGRDDRFRLTGAIHVGSRGVKLPRIGWVRTKESTGKFQGRILSATVRREADRWYVSLAVEVDRPDPTCAGTGIVGVDLGLAAFATLSDGRQYAPSRFLARSLRALRRRQKALSRKQKGSSRRRKAALCVARLHRRVRNRRRDFHHKLSTMLTR